MPFLRLHRLRVTLALLMAFCAVLSGLRLGEEDNLFHQTSSPRISRATRQLRSPSSRDLADETHGRHLDRHYHVTFALNVADTNIAPLLQVAWLATPASSPRPGDPVSLRALTPRAPPVLS